MFQIKDLAETQKENEPPWTKHIEPILVLARGVPARSRDLGRWAYCVAGIGNNGQWVRLYPLPIENGARLIDPFDVIKPFILKKHEDGRPESCKVNPRLVWKTGTVPGSMRKSILERILEDGTFLHNDSWHDKTLGVIKPTSLQISIEPKPTLTFFCDCKDCGGHMVTFFDLLTLGSHGRKLIAPAQELTSLLSHPDEEKLWFVVGTMRKHRQLWIVVEVLIDLQNTIVALQSWLTSEIKRKTSFI